MDVRKMVALAIIQNCIEQKRKPSIEELLRLEKLLKDENDEQ